MALACALAPLLTGACSGEAAESLPEQQETPSASPTSPANAQTRDIGRLALAAGEGDPTSLCGSEEAQIFSCKVRGGKVASVCVVPGAEGEFAQYRFGRAGASPELVWPRDASDQIQWASVSYSGGGEQQLSFALGDIRYVVYSKVVRTNFTPGETNDPSISDGVLVLRDEQVEARYACDGTGLKPIDVDAARSHLAEADDLFTYETG